MNMSEQEEYYEITPLGLLGLKLGDEVGKEVCETLELYCRRNGCGIAIDRNQLLFVRMEKAEE
ncbi:hypothetical protein EBT25_01650 [bacterium]|nr:hypothetical protein [bacterium]